jgi:hypothetical protein
VLHGDKIIHHRVEQSFGPGDESRKEERRGDGNFSCGSVKTASNSDPPSLFHRTAQDLVKATVERVGQASVYGYLPHALQAVSLSLLPAWIAEMVIIRTVKGLKHAADTRAKKA